MSTNTPCPRAEDVRRLLYSTEAQDEASFRALTEHLDQCDSCRRIAETDDREAALEQAVKSIDRQAESQPYPMRLPIDRLNKLLPQYEILGEIGRGGMGVVYRARQLSLDRVVALKVLPAILGVMQPDAVARFRREAAITAGLKHSNIIAVYESGEADGTLFYAMELIEGRSLHDVIEARRARRDGVALAPKVESTTPDEVRTDSTFDDAVAANAADYFQNVAEWIADAAEALDYAHENGVIHRDVKPSNLLLTRHGRVMMSDFGLARPSFAATMTLSPTLMGTCRYMSPEQVDGSGRAVDHLTDIYSLGVTMYEMLALEPPFADAEYHRIIYDIVHTEPKTVRRLHPEIPRDLETICLRAMEKDRRKRYPTAQAMSDDLRRVRLGLPITARRPSPAQTAWRWVRRRRKAVVACAGFLLLASALGYTLNRNDRLRQEALAAKAGEVHQWLFEAQSELADGDAESALALLESALVAYPERVELWIMKAKTLLAMNRVDDAGKFLAQQHRLAPSSWPVRQMLGQLPIITSDDGREPEWAPADIPPAPPLETAQDHYIQALCEPHSKQALALLDEALELDPDHLPALWYRTLCLGDLGEYDRMLLDAMRVVELRPRWAVTQGELGRAFRWVGRAEEADVALSLAIGIEPKRARWYAMRSEARFYLNQLERAMTDAEAALQLAPDLGMAYTVLGSVKMTVRRIDEGESDFRRAIELMPDSPQPYIRRGLLRALNGNWRDGLADLTRATELDPDILCPWDNSRICIHHHRGLCYLTGGRDPEAVAEFTIALELPPKRWTRSLVPRATSYFRMGQFDECIVDTTRAIDLKLADPLTFARRAMAYEMTGEPEKALADYERIMTVKSPIARFGQLATYILLNHLKRTADAEALLQRNVGPGEMEGYFILVFGYFRGEFTAQEFVAKSTGPAQLAETHYFIGRIAEADGRIADAVSEYEQSKQPNAILSEFAAARLRLLKNSASGQTLEAASASTNATGQ